MLRILLVGNYPSDRQVSMKAFRIMLERVLIRKGYYVGCIMPERRLFPTNVNPFGVWKWVGYIDKYCIFPFAMKRTAKQYDIVHICDHSNSIYTAWLRNKPTVVTCHDVIAIEAAKGLIPNWRVGWTGRAYQWLIFAGLVRASAVVCVSVYTKTHLVALGHSGRNVLVALNALNNNFIRYSDEIASSLLREHGLSVGKNYFLHVGSDLPRKNRLFALQVLHRIRTRNESLSPTLVFVGPPLSQEMRDYAERWSMSNAVKVLSNVPHDLLVALYQGAIGLIYPSVQEGFGWPVIEAQACCCPVFASNLAPMTEVGGDGAKYFDPSDADGAAKVILDSLPEVESMKVKGLENLERFSELAMVRGYVDAYNRAMK
jgi:glycosyltransferase involved in cell wall biosynthesis